MELIEIYAEYTPGSAGFVSAVSQYCGFNTCEAIIEAIGEIATTADEFQSIWENGNPAIETRAFELSSDDELYWGAETILRH